MCLSVAILSGCSSIHKRDTSRPFFIMVNHKATHADWMPAPDQFSDKAAFDAFEAIDVPEPPSLFDDYATRHTGIEKRWKIGRDLSLSKLKLFSSQPGEEYQRMTTQQKTSYNAAYADLQQAWQTLLGDPSTTYEDKTRFKYQRYIKD